MSSTAAISMHKPPMTPCTYLARACALGAQTLRAGLEWAEEADCVRKNPTVQTFFSETGKTLAHVEFSLNGVDNAAEKAFVHSFVKMLVATRLFRACFASARQRRTTNSLPFISPFLICTLSSFQEQPKQTTILDLPFLPMVQIFSHLPLHDLLQSRLVCKEWSAYLHNSQFLVLMRIGHQSHNTALVLLRKMTESPNVRRKYYATSLAQSAKIILTHPITISLTINFLLWQFCNLENRALDRLTPAKRQDLVEHYNRSDVCTWEDDSSVCRPRTLSEFKTDQGDVIGYYKEGNNDIYKFILPSIVTYVPLVHFMVEKIPLIRAFWKTPINTNTHFLQQLSLPADLVQDPVLRNYLCPLSGRVMLLPVEDNCNANPEQHDAGHHVFDFFNIDHTNMTARCPVRDQIPLENLRFRFDIFRIVQNRLAQLRQDPSLNGVGWKSFQAFIRK